MLKLNELKIKNKYLHLSPPMLYQITLVTAKYIIELRPNYLTTKRIINKNSYQREHITNNVHILD